MIIVLNPRIQLFTDSTNDLSPELLEHYQIQVVPLYVNFDGEVYRDGVNMRPEQLFRTVEQTGKLPKTSAPSPIDFENAFAPFIERGDDIVYIGLSSELSSTFQNARIAATQFPIERVTVIDSRSLATGIGIQLIKAAKAIEAGKNAQQIQRMLELHRSKVQVEFVIDTLEYLYKGGRCSGVQHVIGSLLKIRPLVKVIDGTLTPTDKVRGKKEKALDQLLSNALAQKEEMDEDVLFVTHASAPDEAAYIKQQLEANTNVKNIIVTEAGCVISSHCGPGTVGIIFSKI